MKQIIFGIIVVFVIVLLLIGMFAVVGSDSTWETPWDDTGYDDPGDTEVGSLSGSWGQEILLEYPDGSLHSLKQESSSMFSMFAGNKEIVGIHYKLKGKATGSCSIIHIDLSGYEYVLRLKQGSITAKIHTVLLSDYGFSTKNLVVDGEWYELISIRTPVSEFAPDSLSDGSVQAYTLYIVPSGSLKYVQSDCNECWKEIGMPGEISFNVEIQNEQGKWLKVEFKSGVDFTESNNIVVPNPPICVDGSEMQASGNVYTCENGEWVVTGHYLPNGSSLKIYGKNENNDHYIHIPLSFQPSIVANSLTVEFLAFKWAAPFYDIVDWDIYAVCNGERTHIGEGIHPYWTVEKTSGVIRNIYEVPVLIDPASFQNQNIDEIIIEVNSIFSNMIPVGFIGTLDLK